MNPLIEIDNAVFGYGNRPVVEVQKLNLSAGRCLGIFGPNGSGKTTLVRGISGLMNPSRGTVERKRELRIGYMPQYRAIDHHWPMSGLDAAMLATSARTRFGWVGSRRKQTVEMMRRLGVETLAPSRFSRLSGGQQQRILLAGVMASDPDILLLDEPTDGLDIHSREMLLNLLRGFTIDGLATVVISHEIQDLIYLADEVARVLPADDPEHAAQIQIVSPSELTRQLTNLSHIGAGS